MTGVTLAVHLVVSSSACLGPSPPPVFPAALRGGDTVDRGLGRSAHYRGERGPGDNSLIWYTFAWTLPLWPRCPQATGDSRGLSESPRDSQNPGLDTLWASGMEASTQRPCVHASLQTELEAQSPGLCRLPRSGVTEGRPGRAGSPGVRENFPECPFSPASVPPPVLLSLPPHPPPCPLPPRNPHTA